MPDAAPDATPDAILAGAFVARLLALWAELLGTDADPAAPRTVLDPDTGWRPTLAALTAEQASRTPLPGGTSIAAHAAHTAYYLERFLSSVAGRHERSDWQGSFRPAVVDEAAWAATQARLFAAADRVESLFRENPAWPADHVHGALANVAHLAYHLGAVRQLLHGARG